MTDGTEMVLIIFLIHGVGCNFFNLGVVDFLKKCCMTFSSGKLFQYFLPLNELWDLDSLVKFRVHHKEISINGLYLYQP